MYPVVILAILVLSPSIAVKLDEQAEIDREAKISKLFDQSIGDGRFFNFDRGNAFNTSVAFTIPLFSFTLPGAEDSVNSGLTDGNTFGVLAFVALFLLAALGVAIYTTSQGGNANAGARNLYSPYFNTEQGNTLTVRVLNAIYELPNAIDIQSCYHLSVCEAYAQPTKYGILGKSVRWISEIERNSSKLKKSSIEQAAEYGKSGEEECYYEYPCLVDPLDTLIFLKRYYL